ncbi:DNA processing protein [Thermocatellispora tengchongensis]|uniref:DNA processing protein n=1 Tax=Thermocatellispora tengchongensis TaxID=1073253 RepID=A0A840P3C6_9ACTN|nr:DNA-processing protein DprA [Thermocatellispora tengchongensis]MBB5132393.1 DNA processing protein [Thermocatellispora tengchongensis]
MPLELRERAALVALLQRPGAKWGEVALSVLERGSAVAVLAEAMRVQEALFAEADPMESAIEEAGRALAEWEAAGIGVHTCLDERYPSRLRSIHQMPPILFSRGRLAADQRAIAVVGTRQASDNGLRIASAVARELALNDVTVVSGLAKGIDTAAHCAALEAGGRTVAVIGTGINKFYPAQNRALQERIARDGLLISQFWPDTPPNQRNFPMRNAVMSGYAAATVVVEAPWKSGARIQARLALEHGRPVVMPDQLLEHDWAREYAEKPGVHVVSGLRELLAVVEQLIAELNAGPDSLPEISALVWSS